MDTQRFITLEANDYLNYEKKLIQLPNRAVLTIKLRLFLRTLPPN